MSFMKEVKDVQGAEENWLIGYDKMHCLQREKRGLTMNVKEIDSPFSKVKGESMSKVM